MEIHSEKINYQQENTLGWYARRMKDFHIQTLGLANITIFQQGTFFFSPYEFP